MSCKSIMIHDGCAAYLIANLSLLAGHTWFGMTIENFNLVWGHLTFKILTNNITSEHIRDNPVK